jgi:hypothetical protein
LDEDFFGKEAKPLKRKRLGPHFHSSLKMLTELEVELQGEGPYGLRKRKRQKLDRDSGSILETAKKSRIKK